jgi:hypothetical protein
MVLEEEKTTDLATIVQDLDSTVVPDRLIREQLSSGWSLVKKVEV